MKFNNFNIFSTIGGHFAVMSAGSHDMEIINVKVN